MRVFLLRPLAAEWVQTSTLSADSRKNEGLAGGIQPCGIMIYVNIMLDDDSVALTTSTMLARCARPCLGRVGTLAGRPAGGTAEAQVAGRGPEAVLRIIQGSMGKKRCM